MKLKNMQFKRHYININTGTVQTGGNWLADFQTDQLQDSELTWEQWEGGALSELNEFESFESGQQENSCLEFIANCQRWKAEAVEADVVRVWKFRNGKWGRERTIFCDVFTPYGVYNAYRAAMNKLLMRYSKRSIQK